jgi:hypothetical protein
MEFDSDTSSIPSVGNIYGDGCFITGSNLLSVACYHVEIESETPPMLRVRIDSGASAHMLPVNNLMYNMSIVNGWVSLGNKIKQIQIGDVGKTA